jgi:DnaK suppressor protein
MTVASVSRRKEAQPVSASIIKHSDAFLRKMEEVLKGMEKRTESIVKGYEQSLAETLNDLGEEGAHALKEEIENLLARERRNLNDIRNALVRIKNKTYGICQQSGLLISAERMEAAPTATTNVVR